MLEHIPSIIFPEGPRGQGKAFTLLFASYILHLSDKRYPELNVPSSLFSLFFYFFNVCSQVCCVKLLLLLCFLNLIMEYLFSQFIMFFFNLLDCISWQNF